MAVFDILFIPRPAVKFGLPDGSSRQSTSAKPWTFRFLTPDLPRQHAVHFTGAPFYDQYKVGKTFDMYVESGGDTFEICGSRAYTNFDLEVNLVSGGGRLVLRTFRAFVQSMGIAENPLDPYEFTGDMEVEETVTEDVDTYPGVVAAQTRIVAADRDIVWQYIGGESPGNAPNFAMVGGSLLSGTVDSRLLDGYASEWQSAMRGIAAHRVEDFFGAAAYVRSATTEGRHVALSNGVALVRAADVEPGYPEEYSTAGLSAVYETETRGNIPVVYDEEWGPPVAGNGIYGNGTARTELKDLIVEKIWKDVHGVYDQVIGSLDSIPWEPANYGARIEQAGHGWLCQGRFISVDGGTYRITLTGPEEETVGIVELIPGTSSDYDFPFAATEDDSFTVTFGKVEVPAGPGEWVEIETVISANPYPGVRIIHMIRQRRGVRWGHPELIPQDPAPATPEEERRYALKVLRKNASP